MSHSALSLRSCLIQHTNILTRDHRVLRKPSFLQTNKQITFHFVLIFKSEAVPESHPWMPCMFIILNFIEVLHIIFTCFLLYVYTYLHTVFLARTL